jgi:hypothetical protein
MSVTTADKSKPFIVEFWWKQVQRYHRLFFRLIDEQPETFAYIPNLEICISTLEHNYLFLIRNSYPAEAELIRQHLFSATRHLTTSLRHLRQDQKLESAYFLNLASSDMALLRYELLSLGIL